MVAESEAGEEREQGLRADLEHAVEQAAQGASQHAAALAAAQQVCGM